MFIVRILATLILISSFTLVSYAQDDPIIDNSDYVQSHFLHKEGLEMLRNRQLQEALDRFSSAIKLNPYNSDFFYGRSQAWYYLNRMAEAESDVLKAIKLAEGQADYHNFAGTVLFKLNKRKESLQHFTIALNSFNSTDVSVKAANIYFNRANLHLAMKNYNEAILDFSEAIQIDPSLDIAYHFRGVAKIRLNMKETACEDFATSFDLGYDRSEDFITRYCK